jgi:hypothetical protein
MLFFINKDNFIKNIQVPIKEDVNDLEKKRFIEKKKAILLLFDTI